MNNPTSKAMMNPASLVSFSDHVMPNFCMSGGVVTAMFA